MSEAAVLELGRGALMTGLSVCAPILAAGLVVGVIISIVLAATQIQEFTLTFVPKLAAMAAAGLLCASPGGSSGRWRRWDRSGPCSA